MVGVEDVEVAKEAAVASRVERPPWRRRRRRQHQHRPPPRQLLRSQYPPSPCPASPGAQPIRGCPSRPTSRIRGSWMRCCRACERPQGRRHHHSWPHLRHASDSDGGGDGESFVLNLLSTLASVGVTNTLPITTHLHTPSHPGNNLCLQRLRKRGVCCAYSGVGMGLVHAGKSGRLWTVEETHPYMLFLQRWWLTGQAVWRGYNVLSLDTDLHLATNPLAMLSSAPYAHFDAIMQLDSAWPVEGHAEGQAPTDERGQHVNVVPCRRPPMGAADAADADAHGCACGVVPSPLLNTGFVYVRASAGAAVTSLPQLIYNRSVEKILHRLGRPPNHDAKGQADPHAVWAQDVVNEVANEMATPRRMGGLLAVVLVAVVVVVVVVVFRTPVSSARYRLPASSALGHRRARCQAALVAPQIAPLRLAGLASQAGGQRRHGMPRAPHLRANGHAAGGMDRSRPPSRRNGRPGRRPQSRRRRRLRRRRRGRRPPVPTSPCRQPALDAYRPRRRPHARCAAPRFGRPHVRRAAVRRSSVAHARPPCAMSRPGRGRRRRAWQAAPGSGRAAHAVHTCGDAEGHP